MQLTSDMTKQSLLSIRRMPVPLSQEESMSQDQNLRAQGEYLLSQVGAGGYLSVEGKIWYVEAKHRYEETWERKTSKWYELKLVCLTTQETLFLEWEIDDELEVSLWKKEVPLRNLGLTPDSLWKMDDDEKGKISLDGRTYAYDDSGDAMFFKNSQGPGEKFYYWDFECKEDDDYMIGTERWGESEFLASIGYFIPFTKVTILVIGG